MSWIEVRATFEPALDLSPYIEIYRCHGIENTLEEGSTLVGCLVNVAGVEEKTASLEQALWDAGATEVQSHALPEVNWEESWKQFFKPRRIGNRFVVRPTWEEFHAQAGDLQIVLDPGQAFGTGDHPTTRMCLELLELAEVEGKRVADVGCGSGILSVGACLLGASEVIAVDIEDLSVEVAKENASRNGVSFDARVGDGLKELDGDFDIVISNIISAILIRLSRDVPDYVRPGGLWIVSGIIHQNWPDVLAAIRQNGFHLLEKREEGDWVAATFQLP